MTKRYEDRYTNRIARTYMTKHYDEWCSNIYDETLRRV